MHKARIADLRRQRVDNTSGTAQFTWVLFPTYAK